MAIVTAPIEEWMKVLRTMRGIGRTQQVDSILTLVRQQADADELHRLSGELADHARWLEQAVAFERERGPDSMLDRTHPVYVRAAESIRRFTSRETAAA